MSQAITSLPCRKPTKDRIADEADRNRVKLTDFADCLANGWEMLTPEQRRQAIERQPDTQPAPTT